MTYALIAPPAAEALTLADVKAHLRIDHADEDALLNGLIAAARQHLESLTGLALISQTQGLYLDCWPEKGVVEITRGPVQAIEAIHVYDEAGEETVVDLSEHVLDGVARPARLYMRGVPFAGRPLNGVEIDFVAGFGEAGADVPDTLKRAMLAHIATMYEFRGAIALADQPAAVPDGYERLIAPFRIRRL